MAHIGICMPYYSQPHPATVAALAALEETSIHSYVLHPCVGVPNIDFARALCLADWLNDPRHTHLMTLDSDIWWWPNSIDRLVERDLPVVAGLYSFKSDHPHLRGRPVAIAMPDQDPTSVLFKLSRVAAGFVLYKRSVIERLCKLNKDTFFHLPVNESCPENEGKTSYGLWTPFFHRHPTGYIEYLTDDWAISQRLLNAGYTIWADGTVRLRHCEPGNKFHEIGGGNVHE